jgi:hypothetical protein
LLLDKLPPNIIPYLIIELQISTRLHGITSQKIVTVSLTLQTPFLLPVSVTQNMKIYFSTCKGGGKGPYNCLCR